LGFGPRGGSQPTCLFAKTMSIASLSSSSWLVIGVRGRGRGRDRVRVRVTIKVGVRVRVRVAS